MHSIDEWKGTMAKLDGLLFKSTSPAFPAVCSSTAGREQGLHQGCSVDRANKSRPMTCWIAPFWRACKFGRDEEKSRRTLFWVWSSPWPLGGKGQGRATASASMVTGRGMETSLLWKIGSHAPTKEMSRILRAAGPGRSLYRPGTFSSRL